MTTSTQAYAVIKARLEAGGLGVPLRFQNEDADSEGNVPLPDTPANFIYSEWLTDRARLASFGGGRGQNRYRHPARLTGYIMVPRGVGLAPALTLAEAYAALFRSHRDDDISCFEATVYPGGAGADLKPPGVDSAVDNYFYASVEVNLFYDLIG